MTQQITGELFRLMVINAAAAIENHRQEINELNVFPVPDGDTGTNMGLTISAAAKALVSDAPESVGRAAELTASALLRGARGNSGVILSLLFRGFARHLKDAPTADAAAIAGALASGVDSAYKAVMKPAEGTILTVARLAAAGAAAASESSDNIEFILEQALETGYIALGDTMYQNPVLKKAGVVDAGAKGYLYILEGMLAAIRGKMLDTTPQDEPAAKADFNQFSAGDITFTYCTEFIAEKKLKTDAGPLRTFLSTRGDSIVVVDDDEIIKVHVHTNEPGTVLTEALTYGALLTVKIENMRQQHTETISAAAPEPDTKPPQSAPPPREMKKFAIVAVCAGDGLENVFRDLGADEIITGGQTMNPSTEDILEKITAAPSDTVFVLPNNKNIIMAAEQCAPLTDKRVIVIPSRSVPQGISALLAADEAEGTDDISQCMTDAAKRVRTAQITLAARDSQFDGLDIKEGEYIALIDDKLSASGPDAADVIDAVARALSEFNPEFLTVFSGENITEADAKAVAARIGACSPTAETAVIHGGQPVYHFIISAE